MARPMQQHGSRISQGGHRGQTDSNCFPDRARGHVASERRGRTVFLEQLLGFRGLRSIWGWRIVHICGSLVRFLFRGSLLGLHLLRALPVRLFAGVRPHPHSSKLFCCFREPLPSPLAVVLRSVRLLRLLRLAEAHSFLVELRAQFRPRIFVPVLRVRLSDVRLRLPGLRLLVLRLRLRLLQFRLRIELRLPGLRGRAVWWEQSSVQGDPARSARLASGALLAPVQGIAGIAADRNATRYGRPLDHVRHGHHAVSLRKKSPGVRPAEERE